MQKRVEELSNGVIFILAEEQYEQDIKKYIHDKNNEAWVSLIWMDSETDKICENLGKYCVSMEYELPDIYSLIREKI